MESLRSSKASDIPSTTATEGDLILPEIRRWIWVPFLLAIANGVFLFCLPWMAETDYAWSIKPPVNAAFLGAGYLSGVLSTALALFMARYWRSVRSFMWPFTLLSIGLLLATIIHNDRFRWGYPLTYMWTAVYILIPVAAPLMVFYQARRKTGTPAADPRLTAFRYVSGALGLIILVSAVIMYIIPDNFVQSWPWQITPLLVRALTSWYMFMGLILLFGAFTVRLASELLVPTLTVGFWSLLLLTFPLLYSGSMRMDSAGFWVWLALHLVLLLVCAWMVVRAFRLMRTEGQHF